MIDWPTTLTIFTIAMIGLFAAFTLGIRAESKGRDGYWYGIAGWVCSITMVGSLVVGLWPS